MSETTVWDGITPGQKCFTTRNGTALVAWVAGGGVEPTSPWVTVAAHTDSPVLKVKPISAASRHGALLASTQVYGGGLWYSWLDRGLGVAGRVLCSDKASGKVVSKLVHVDRAIARVPSLAIHLQTAEERKALKLNEEDHLNALLALQTVDETLNGKTGGPALPGASARHVTPLVTAIAEAADVDPASVLDFDLCMFDVQGAYLGGAREEFICAPRQDNLSSCFSGLQAILDAAPMADDGSAQHVAALALFDHEEVGSTSAPGANGSLLADVLTRSVPEPAQLMAAKAQSLIISADMAHAVHPNYASKHEVRHAPQLGGGLVLKFNANQRYATTPLTAHFVEAAAASVGMPVQRFVVRCDSGCGSTVGPMLSANTGIRTVDLGGPMLSMHSASEFSAVPDLEACTAIITALVQSYSSILESVDVEEC